MRIELTNQIEQKAFDIIHPATCFIPLLAPEHKVKPANRNVWFKLAPPCESQAVNLYSGEIMNMPSGTICEPVDARVVVE